MTKGGSVHLHRYSGVQVKARTGFLYLKKFLSGCI